MWYYQPKKDDSAVIDKLNELAEKLPTKGIDYLYHRLRQQGYTWNRKRVLRVYRAMKMTLRRKRKRRVPSRIKEPLVATNAPNLTWSMDFMSDSLMDGRKIRTFNIIDDFNREVMEIEVGLSFPAERVLRTLDRLGNERGLPNKIRVDNGPEFTANVFRKWCAKRNITVKYIQPGSPTQNAYIERFNKTYRNDVLDAYWIEDLDHLVDLTHYFKEEYNNYHPHKSLGRLSPVQYRNLYHQRNPSSILVKAKMNVDNNVNSLDKNSRKIEPAKEVVQRKILI